MATSKGKTAKGSDNIYASVWDALADTPEQAANLRARAELMRQIAEVVKDSGWTQVDAATRCGITQPRINDLLRGRKSRFSIDALVNIATALGRTVSFELQVARGRRAASQRGSGHPSSAAL
jgi:predicted XRE-type DNA-binding protein